MAPSIRAVRQALHERGLVEQVRGAPGRVRIKVSIIMSTQQVAARVLDHRRTG